MSFFVRISLFASALAVLSACGLKGPLRLPEKTAPATVTPASTPQPTTHSSAPLGASDDKTNQPLPKPETSSDNKNGNDGK